jgi:hypothetical protein
MLREIEEEPGDSLDHALVVKVDVQLDPRGRLRLATLRHDAAYRPAGCRFAALRAFSLARQSHGGTGAASAHSPR